MQEALVEVHTGVGGIEAKRWSDDVYQMLLKYSQGNGYQVEELGRAGECRSMIVKGKDACEKLQWEAGIHEVQRFPRGEHYGRIHSSTAGVAVLPAADKEGLDDKDLRIEASLGMDGLHPSLVVTHLPTGVQAQAESYPSLEEGIEEAMRILQIRVGHAQEDQKEGASHLIRQEQLGGGYRAERIRTYNFKEGRVKDHRSGVLDRNLKRVLDGNLEGLHPEVSDETVYGGGI